MSYRRRFTRLAGFAYFFHSLVGCSSIDTVNGRAETVNRSNSDYGNTAIFLNILRASQFEPLSFAYVSSFQAHNGVGGSLGSPSATFAQNFALGSFATGSASATYSDSSDYAINISDDKDFYGALAVPLDPVTINTFSHYQDYPRELLFFLAVDSLTVTQRSGATQYMKNNPLSPSFGAFGGELADLLNAGLTSIALTETPQRSPSVTNKSDKSNSKDGGKENADSKDLSKPKTVGAICFDKALQGASFHSTHVETFVPLCDDLRANGFKPPSHNDATFLFTSNRGEKVRMSFRSTFGIYEYLGRFILDRSGIANLVPSDDNGDPRLLTITNNTNPEGCFVSTEYKGVFYCVPHKAYTTKRVFTLLRQLAAQNTPVAPPATTTAVHLTTP